MMSFVQHQELISEAALLKTQSKWYKLLFSACLGAKKLGLGGGGVQILMRLKTVHDLA